MGKIILKNRGDKYIFNSKRLHFLPRIGFVIEEATLAVQECFAGKKVNQQLLCMLPFV